MSMKKSFFVLALLLVTTACFPSPVPQNSLPEPPTLTLQPTSLVESLFTPTALINIQDDTFSLENLNTVLPEDVIQEVGYFGGMGGCGRFCNCMSKNFTGPEVFLEKDAAEVMGNLGIEICGLSADEIVTVGITRPDGVQTKSQAGKLNSGYADMDISSAFFEYIPSLGDPFGSYLFTFSGNGWIIEKHVDVLDVQTPHLFNDPEKNLLILRKFKPNENVRVFAYGSGDTGNKLIGWKSFQTDENGNREIQNSLDAKFIAVGEESGQVFGNTKGNFWGDWFGIGAKTDIYCPGAPAPVGIDPGGYAVVMANELPHYELIYGVNNLGVYNIESLKRSGFLRKDTYLKIESNAICSNGQFYWTVSCVDASCGYVAVPEAGPDEYYLQPMDELPLLPTSEVVNLPACPGTLPTRLQVGVSAQVTTSGMAPQLSLRAQPSMSAEKVHVIAAGRKIVILEGPVCADESYWWRINVPELGFEGWAREGDYEDYWIDPLP